MEHVDLAPHFRADERAERAGVGAGVFQIAGDGGGVAAVQQIEALDVVGIGREAARLEVLLIRVDADQAEPGIGLEAGALEALGDIDQPGQVLDALEVARHPEQSLGVAREQGIEAHAGLIARLPRRRCRPGPRCPSSRRPGWN